ncbi:MAG TPA: zinc ribbon domain-containing protein [Pyrinomonadaceae bacterium]|nr:zinc ribbon domain-containing protein [Pyrinomonadaceae bacterium]
MALAKCPECGHDMSTDATVCPNCGWQNAVVKEPERVYVAQQAAEEKSGCSLGTIIVGLLAGLGIFALLAFFLYPYVTGEQPPPANTVNVNLTIDATNTQTTEIKITTPEPRETPPPPTPRPTQPPPTPRPTPERPATPTPRPPSTPSRSGNSNR